MYRRNFVLEFISHGEYIIIRIFSTMLDIIAISPQCTMEKDLEIMALLQ